MNSVLKAFVCGLVGAWVMGHAVGFAAYDAEDRFIRPEYSKKISMDFKGAALPEVLKIFSKQSGMNFITAQDVSAKKITLFMKDVPVEEALDKILDANDLAYELNPSGDMFVVKAKEITDKVITRVYPLKFATVPSSKLNKTISISGDSGSSTASSSLSSEGIFPVLKSVLTKVGNIQEDARTNSLIISDVESQFTLIEQTLASLDITTPQILIEVEMLDVSKTTAEQMGVKFGSTPLSFTGGSRSVYYPWDQGMLLDKRKIVFPEPGGSSSSSSESESGEYTPGTVKATGMSALLQFLRTQTDTRNLARPRLLTLNNETAQIKISTNEAIGVQTVTTSSAESTPGSATKQAERMQTGVFLTVTPQANLITREITLAVSPKVIDATSRVTFGTDTFSNPEERGSESILIVKDGETMVMGGLLRKSEGNTTTKLPILGDIPLLGSAFRHKDKSGSERELIIFITPHIVDQNNKKALKLQKEDSDNITPTVVVDHSVNRIEEVGKNLDHWETGAR